MIYTVEELKEYIKSNVNEVDLLEILNLTTEDIVERFSEEIETKYSYIISQLGLECNVRDY